METMYVGDERVEEKLISGLISVPVRDWWKVVVCI